MNRFLDRLDHTVVVVFVAIVVVAGVAMVRHRDTVAEDTATIESRKAGEAVGPAYNVADADLRTNPEKLHAARVRAILRHEPLAASTEQKDEIAWVASCTTMKKLGFDNTFNGRLEHADGSGEIRVYEFADDVETGKKTSVYKSYRKDDHAVVFKTAEYGTEKVRNNN